MSSSLYVLVVALFTTSFFVRIEPAPFDLLIVCAAVIIVASGRSFVIHGMWLVSLILALFLLANIVPILTGIVLDDHRALFYLLITVYLFILFYIVAALVSRFGARSAEAVLLGCTFAAVISSVIGVAAVSGIIPGSDTLLYSGRAKAFFKDPNVFGPFSALGVVWLIHASERRQRAWQRALTILGIIICSVGVVFSFSRGAWLGLGVALFVYYSVRINTVGLRRYFPKIVAPILITLVVGSVGAINLLVSSGTDELFYSRLEAKPYDEDRFYVQQLALHDSASNPLGRGPGQSELIFPDLSRLGTPATHSLPLRLLFENGWFGAVAFGIFLALTTYVSVRSAFGGSDTAPIGAVVLAVLAGTLVQGIFIDTLHWRHLWIIAGLAWGLHGYELANAKAVRLSRGCGTAKRMPPLLANNVDQARDGFS